jgi:hypothetical protein
MNKLVLKKYLSFSTLFRLIAAGMLFYALKKLPYSYFTILRFVVCGAAAYTAFVAYKSKSNAWAFVFGAIDVLFNPLILIELDRKAWIYVDVGVGVFFLISIFYVQEAFRKV